MPSSFYPAILHLPERVDHRGRTLRTGRDLPVWVVTHGHGEVTYIQRKSLVNKGRLPRGTCPDNGKCGAKKTDEYRIGRFNSWDSWNDGSTGSCKNKIHVDRFANGDVLTSYPVVRHSSPEPPSIYWSWEQRRDGNYVPREWYDYFDGLDIRPRKHEEENEDDDVFDPYVAEPSETGIIV